MMKTQLLVGAFMATTMLVTAQTDQEYNGYAKHADILSKPQPTQNQERIERHTAKGADDIIIYWSEDFSNGLLKFGLIDSNFDVHGKHLKVNYSTQT